MASDGEPEPRSILFACSEREIKLLKRVRAFVHHGDVDQFMFDVAEFAIVEKTSKRVERLGAGPLRPLVTA